MVFSENFMEVFGNVSPVKTTTNPICKKILNPFYFNGIEDFPMLSSKISLIRLDNLYRI